MNPLWWRTVAVLTVLAVSAVLLAVVAGATAAGFSVAIALLLLWLRDQRQLMVLWNWSQRGRAAPLPPASGPWDELFARLYRQARDTERHQDALTDALLSFRRAAQALPDGVIMLNDSNQILWCNDQAEQHFSLRLESDAGQNINNLLRAPDFSAYLSSGDWEQPTLLRLRRGSSQDAMLSIQLVEYGDAQKLLLSRDITKIERLETMRRDFVANVSHELKTPLTVLAGFLETIREVKLPVRQQDHYLALMSEQAERMRNLVADLLTLSALEADTSPVHEAIDMCELVGRIEAAAVELSKGTHALRFSVEPDLNLIGSETEVLSALTNLVTNAIRYTPKGGTIEVRWCSATPDEPSGAVFRVTDTGIGIPAHHLPRLTERFYRVDRGRSRESGGTGLGLAIVKHVLTRHQAHLDVQSTVGVGSRFTAVFPEARLIRGPVTTNALPDRAVQVA